MSCMSGSSNLNSFRDRGQVAVQLVSCGVLLPGLVQDCTQHSCVIAISLNEYSKKRLVHEKRINSTKLQVSVHTIYMYSTLSCYIHTEMTNLWFGASPAIKSYCLQESGPCLSLSNYLPPLTDILWKTRSGIKIFYVGLLRNTDILVEAVSEI